MPEVAGAVFDPTLLSRTARIDPAGRCSVGGVDLEALANQYGTPLFVYDEDDLRARCREYATAFPGGVHYASKAFLCRAMARLAVDEGLDIDVATGGELHLVRSAGVDAQRVVVHGNNKSEDELRDAIQAGVKHIVLDSGDELDRIERLVHDEHLAPPALLVRVNPGVEAHTHEYLATGAEDSKFGFSIADGSALAVIERIVASGVAHLGGLHCHIGSQIFRSDGFDAALDHLGALVASIEAATGVLVEELDLGGGLGVRYTTDDDPPSVAQHAARVHESLAGTLAAHQVRSRPRLTTEPGRSIAAQAALTLYRVGTIKRIEGVRTYVSVDGGISDNPRPALYGARYEVFVPTRSTARRDQVVTLAGKHCEQGDLLVRDARLPSDLAIGDLVATPCTGAYGYAMASNYNRVPRPAVVFVRNGDARLVIRRETDDDMARLDLG